MGSPGEQSSTVVQCGMCGLFLFRIHYGAGEYVIACVKGHIIKRFFTIQPEGNLYARVRQMDADLGSRFRRDIRLPAYGVRILLRRRAYVAAMMYRRRFNRLAIRGQYDAQNAAR